MYSNHKVNPGHKNKMQPGANKALEEFHLWILT